MFAGHFDFSADELILDGHAVVRRIEIVLVPGNDEMVRLAGS